VLIIVGLVGLVDALVLLLSAAHVSPCRRFSKLSCMLHVVCVCERERGTECGVFKRN